ncbi:isoprenylcysteine carboxylmethyltransferase family protein [Streptomonospora sp. PA3]|uniref:methyltransferase family protein n=1 Tax=Streptomonospora sp. PA3 TaxID=2607326 RepID=UPI0012DCFB5D|nr:isoprenylcysteine carboxylmethyltransferase family protein [Streptomonospora sp. PA3]MUL41688.1 isoprenylcysteine carboxylmethyltransferase family protein [Streptomonospora sp. PA3]
MAAWIALGYFVVLLAVAFGGQVWRHYRRTGDTGLRVGAPAGSAQWWVDLAFAAALAVGFAAPVAALLGADPLFESGVAAAAGIALLTLLLVAVPLAQGAMGASWRMGVDTGERTRLVTGGPFRLVRNPVYTLVAAAFAGLLLLVPNVVAAAGLLLAVTAVQAQVRLVEEPYLLRVHGDAYRDYAAATGRFVPRLGRLRRERHPLR